MLPRGPLCSEQEDAEVKKGHTEEQILRALHQAEGGAKVADICREHGVSEATYYVWKKKYSGLRLRELREENAKLKRLVADRSLDRHTLIAQASIELLAHIGKSHETVAGEEKDET